jgi:hypothetical protein
MTTTSFTSAQGDAAHGATALSSMTSGRPDHSRHLLGDAMRAVRVFGAVVAEVVLLGRIDDRPGPAREDPRPPPPSPPTPSAPTAIPPQAPSQHT